MIAQSLALLLLGVSNVVLDCQEKAVPCLPFGVNRVFLDAGYYHASHLAAGGEHYIVADIPNEKTQNRFWQLVDQENVDMVVTLGEWEGIPDESQAKTLFHRRFSINQAENIDQSIYRHNGSKLVHLHYFCKDPLLEMSEKAMALLQEKLALFHKSTTPILVQSAHAVGMSGVFIACHELIKQGKPSAEPIEAVMARLNQQRPFLIKEPEHLQLIKHFQEFCLQKHPSNPITALTCRHTL